MYLIQKGEKPQLICRHCKALHRPKDCPRADSAVLEVFRQKPAGLTWEALMEVTGLQYWQVKASVRRLTDAGFLRSKDEQVAPDLGLAG